MSANSNPIELEWGGRFEKLLESELNQIDLPIDTIQFLAEIGLPNEPKQLDERGRSFTFHSNALEVVSKYDSRFLIIGHTPFLNVGIREHDGHVYVLDTPGIKTDHLVFVNSSVVTLLKCIQAYIRLLPRIYEYFDTVRPISSTVSRMLTMEEQIEEHEKLLHTIEDIKKIFGEIDPASVSEDVSDTFWLQVFDDWSIG